MKFLLKMLVHDVDHAVSKAPEREKKNEKDEDEQNVTPVFQYEHSALSWCVHNSLVSKDQTHLRKVWINTPRQGSYPPAGNSNPESGGGHRA